MVLVVLGAVVVQGFVLEMVLVVLGWLWSQGWSWGWFWWSWGRLWS